MTSIHLGEESIPARPRNISVDESACSMQLQDLVYSGRNVVIAYIKIN